MLRENKGHDRHPPSLAKVPQDKVHESGCLYFGCHDDDDDAAECASAHDDEDVDDAARRTFADCKAGVSLQCEITTGSEGDVGVG